MSDYRPTFCCVYIFRLNENAALLSNTEVLMILENLKADLKGSKYGLQNANEGPNNLVKKEKGLQRLNTIVYETVKYLEEMPCATQNAESVQTFLTAISAYSLTKGEKLQLLNLRPTSLVEVQLLIEESEERFTEDQMNEILAVISDTLPPAPNSESQAPSEADYDENG
ncbi:LOW QUALITY PROTEIN: DNA-directed RNA polymerase III subunit RPC9-like [Uloborus diversus]|uniref:LOW QUALITY PROTEIN: DNA-directed RNA polymerase III subunit RPC9-like n=1 Tax=Uloborus diversus TaxID=327109 RepID=UPI00240A9561|nr:LOW QUALITY PROTEIN: DNA-directed RNA polymerase III subunit RPC9-like [Uloborus diversus]